MNIKVDFIKTVIP